jgi:hypothetical protein
LLTWRTQLIGRIPEVLILSGTYTCNYGYEENVQPLVITVWVLNAVWEVPALCLAVWIAVKHFRDQRRFGLSTGSTIGDCFRVLIKSHVFYFARWALDTNVVIFTLLKFRTSQLCWCLLPPACSCLSISLGAPTCR